LIIIGLFFNQLDYWLSSNLYHFNKIDNHSFLS